MKDGAESMHYKEKDMYLDTYDSFSVISIKKIMVFQISLEALEF